MTDHTDLISEKIQKALARKGLGSRREIERWVGEGRIRVNGRTAKVGDRITPKDKVEVDGKVMNRLFQAPKRRVLMYNKPEGEVCSRDDTGQATVFDHLPKLTNGRWISVGRLDVNSSGLLLLTTDGELANALMHPKSEIEREYAVRVYGEPSNDELEKLLSGIWLDDGWSRFEVIESSGGNRRNHWFHVIVKEGRNRLVRRMWESLGYSVSRLVRVRFDEFVLPENLSQGNYIELPKRSIKRLASYL